MLARASTSKTAACEYYLKVALTGCRRKVVLEQKFAKKVPPRRAHGGAWLVRSGRSVAAAAYQLARTAPWKVFSMKSLISWEW